MLTSAYQKSYYVREKSPAIKVKEDTVGYAKYTWPLLFSRFYEAFRLDGPPLPKNDVRIKPRRNNYVLPLLSNLYCKFSFILNIFSYVGYYGCQLDWCICR